VEVTNPAKSTIKKPYDAKSLTNSRRMAMVWKIKIIAILLYYYLSHLKLAVSFPPRPSIFRAYMCAPLGWVENFFS